MSNELTVGTRFVHTNGGTYTVVGIDDGTVWAARDDSAHVTYLTRQSDDIRIARILPERRYNVDTVFHVGETYETRGGGDRETVKSLGLICKDQNGEESYRKPDGTRREMAGVFDLIPPTPAKPTCEVPGEVTIDGKVYTLTPKVEG